VKTEPVRVEGDPVRLEQVIANLVHNAIKYTPPGGRIAIRVRREGEQAAVRVEDTGIGIEPEMLPRIFDLFTQVESSLPRSQGGLGLGLPLVRNLVELHGGRVMAASAGAGRGSEFTVLLPLLDAADEPTGHLVQPRVEGAGHAGRFVLVVEDNADGRESLRDLLEIWGHRVVLAQDGNDGYSKALSAKPDVALIDIGLPGIDGYEVARQIRAKLNNRSRRIALSGYGQEKDRQRAFQAGFDDHLLKPVDPTRLLAVLTAPRTRR
jgi:CheY-like chemotaxis protein